MDKILDLCKQLALEAGNKIMEIYNTDFEVYSKDDESPLTKADKEANEIIVSKLKEVYPQYSILSEESKEDETRFSNEYCFVVDPLDGTKEFVKKNGEFTVNIALVYKGKSILGVIYAPVLNELYYGYEGFGSYLENVKTNEVKKIEVTNKTTDLIMVASKSHSSEKEANLIDSNKDKISENISKGSSLKGCMVATGEADVYYRFGLTCEWDTCAMQCIVEEAGGIFKQMDNTDMTYNRKNTLNEKGFYIVNKVENIWV